MPIGWVWSHFSGPNYYMNYYMNRGRSTVSPLVHNEDAREQEDGFRLNSAGSVRAFAFLRRRQRQCRLVLDLLQRKAGLDPGNT
jgi:hypothetical protein